MILFENQEAVVASHKHKGGYEQCKILALLVSYVFQKENSETMCVSYARP